MATYNELANTYATNAKNEYLNSLSYLTDDLAAQNKLNQEALTQKYNNLFDQINRQQDVVNQQYSQDAKSAYLNKLLAGRALDESLSQLGLSTGGFGVNQRLANETAYGQNLAALQQTRNEGLRDIAGKLTDAMGEYNVATAELDSNYLAQLLAAKSKQQAMADDKYQLAYNQYLADLKYQDELKQYQEQFEYQKKQDEIANAQKWAQINAAKKSSSNTGSDTKLGNYAKGILSQIEKQYNIGEDMLTQADISDIHSRLLKSIDSGFMTDNEAMYIWSYLGLDENSLNTSTSPVVEQPKDEPKQEEKKPYQQSVIQNPWYHLVQHPIEELLKVFK